MRRSAALLLFALTSSAIAQDPGFPPKGAHYDHSASFGPNVSIKRVFADKGIVLAQLAGTKKQVIFDLRGRQIAPSAFSYIFPMNKKLASATGSDTSKRVLIDIPGKRILGPWDASTSFQALLSGEIIHTISRDKAVLCELDGAKLKPISAVYSKITRHSLPGMFWAKKNGKWGAVGVDGQTKVPFLYEKIEWLGTFGNTRLRVTIAPNRVGIIMPDGRQVMPCVYRTIADPVNDVCAWTTKDQSGEHAGATDLKTGKSLMKIPATSKTQKFSLENVDGRFFTVTARTQGSFGGGRKRVYDVRRGFLSKSDYVKLKAIPTPNGPLFLTRSSKTLMSGQPSTLRDSNFKEIDAKTVSILATGPEFLVAMRIDGKSQKMCLMGFDGRVVFPNSRFQGVPKGKGGYYGRVPVKTATGMGYADLNGNDVVPAKFKSAGLFNSYGLARVATAEGVGVIDRDGKSVVAPTLADAYCFPTQPFLLALTKDGKIVLRANSGEEYFRADKRFQLNVVAPNLLLATEMKDKKIARSFLFTLK